MIFCCHERNGRDTYARRRRHSTIKETRRLGHLFAGRRQLPRSEALDLLAELKHTTLYFAQQERPLPDELDAYAERFPRLRELFGDDQIFLGRVRRKRQVRALAETFGMTLPQADG